jgi:hypothetical protein
MPAAVQFSGLTALLRVSAIAIAGCALRDDPMPSGLSTFSTMMGVDLNSPAREGPFVPSEIYEGDIRDTPALEAWVLRIAAQRAGIR